MRKVLVVSLMVGLVMALAIPSAMGRTKTEIQKLPLMTAVRVLPYGAKLLTCIKNPQATQKFVQVLSLSNHDRASQVQLIDFHGDGICDVIMLLDKDSKTWSILADTGESGDRETEYNDFRVVIWDAGAYSQMCKDAAPTTPGD